MQFIPPYTGNNDLDAFLSNLANALDSVSLTTTPAVEPDLPNGEPKSYKFQYLHIKYADDNTGTNMSDDPSFKTYFGIFNSETDVESTNPADYTWYATANGFGAVSRLYYLILGNRTIKFAIATGLPDYKWVMDDVIAIDLDVLVPDLTVSYNELMNGAVTELKIADAAVTATKTNIAALDQATGGLKPNTVSAAQIMNDAVTELKILDGAITNDKIYANAVTSDKIAANSIGANQIAANAVTAVKIEAGSVTTEKIFAGAVTADKMTVNNLAAITANMGTLTAGTITGTADLKIFGDADFQGQTTSTYTLPVNGISYPIDYSSFSVGATSAGSSRVRVGAMGRANSVNSQWNVGVVGTAVPGFYNANAIGVFGQGYFGGYFTSDSTAGAGIVAEAANTSSAALYINRGYLKFINVNIMPPDGGTDRYLRNDGTWAPVAGLGGGTVTSVSGTGSVSGLTLSGTVTTSGSLTLSGSLSLTTSNLTATAPGSNYFLSGGGWTTVTVVSTLNGASGNVSNSFSANNSIAGTVITVSGSGTNNVTYNFSSTSDRSLKKDIKPVDKGLSFVNSLNPVTYLWDTEHITFDKKVYGLIANEVLDLTKEESSLVYTNPNGVFKDKLAVDYQSLVPVLIKAIQELSAEVELLKSKL